MGAGVSPFEMRHVTDSIFYAILFLTTGATTEFLMKKSAQAVAHRDREASEAIGASEEPYRRLFENATDIVYEHDLQGNFTSFNRAAQKRLGYSLSDLPGLTIADVVDPDDLDHARHMIGAKLEQQGGTTSEPCDIEGHALSVGASIGIALFPQDAGDVDTLLQCADAAMYEAKRSRAGCRLFGPELDAKTRPA
jgi:PAS domain S-box-containing protein